MNYFNRIKWSTVALWLLVSLNIATLSAFLLIRGKRPGPPQSGPVEFISAELGFDAAQKQQFIGLVKRHQQQMQEIRKGNREAKDAFFALLQQPGLSDTALEQAAREASRFDVQTDIVTFRHFKQVRALCTDAQKEKFDGIIQEVLRMNAGPGPHPPPPGNGE